MIEHTFDRLPSPIREEEWTVSATEMTASGAFRAPDETHALGITRHFSEAGVDPF